MKHTGGRLCGQYKFETELDPMLIIQCNCSKCRKLSGSYQIGCLYSEDEIQESGETEVYEEVMEGMVGIPLGIFDTAKSLSPKAEIWTAEKLPFLKTDDCIAESFEDSGIAERLNALLENLENR